MKVVRLLGGEPLLHPDFAAVIDAVRRAGVGDTIAVVTNGLLLPRMAPELWSRIDSVEVSMYPGRSLTVAAQEQCADNARRHGVQIRFRACAEFQESYSETGTDDVELVDRIYTTCNVAHRWRCHNVIDGWFYRCPQSHYIPKILDDDPDARTADGIEIDDSPAFGPRLLAYLQSAEPPRSCANCLGTAGRYEPHEQIRRAEFRDRQVAPTEDLVHPRLVGIGRVSLARIESLAPRRVVAPVEDALLSPTFIRTVQKTQRTTRAALHLADRRTVAHQEEPA